jgi:predicted ATPase
VDDLRQRELTAVEQSPDGGDGGEGLVVVTFRSWKRVAVGVDVGLPSVGCGQQRDLLLILDNMEQVLDARGFVADLLAATAGPRILVTSRSPLHLSWEQEFPVPPLPVPGRGSVASAAAVAGCESVRLFAARAAASVPGFTVTDENAAAITGIAQRLDGLPLPIELAAAWVKLLPPAVILARLEHSLGLLVNARRDVPDRQRTLRATIAWSYELLTEAAKRLLAVCSVSGWHRPGHPRDRLRRGGRPAPTCVGGPGGVGRPQPAPAGGYGIGVGREVRNVETVREFAAEQLAQLPGHERVRAAHASAFWDLATDLARPPSWPQRAGLDRLEGEHEPHPSPR